MGSVDEMLVCSALSPISEVSTALSLPPPLRGGERSCASGSTISYHRERVMLTMIGKRLMFAIPSLIGVVIVTFLLTRALPGDPAAYFAGPAATKEAIE